MDLQHGFSRPAEAPESVGLRPVAVDRDQEELWPPERAAKFDQRSWTPSVVYNAESIRFEASGPPHVPIKDALKVNLSVDVLDGGHWTLPAQELEPTYLRGCKFKMTIGNDGDRPIIVRDMNMDVAWDYFPTHSIDHKPRDYGRILIPHQLFLQLRKDRWDGWWMLSDGARLSDTPRTVSSTNSDLLASDGMARMGFELLPGSIEYIEGAITAREPGRYRVEFRLLGTDAAHSTVAIAEPIQVAFVRD